ncbi:glycosyltransferase family 2 protein [Petrimonas sp.]|uniref:glycosyltransferase family 2 protein n=1 Tax=Petrimonas sp. TaxID=2023866 RepID=UPI002FC6755A
MYDNPTKISVILITYNQEKVIGRAIDSVLCQKEYVYEIIIGDDCSTDNNWEIITSYKKKYPDIIKPIRNEKNLGIFGNIENLYDKLSGDLVFFLSGDDVFCDGLFKKTIETIKKKSIDYKNELFAIYFDHRIVFADKRPNYKFSNSLIVKGLNPVRLKIRNLISVRTSCVSVNVLQKFTQIRKDIGIFADGLIDIQQMLYSEKNYYCKYVGSIYNAGIGVSVNVNTKDRAKSYLMYLNELQTILKLCHKDNLRVEYYKYQTLFFLNPSIYNFSKTLINYFASTDLSFGFKGLQIFDLFKFILRALSILPIKI